MHSLEINSDLAKLCQILIEEPIVDNDAYTINATPDCAAKKSFYFILFYFFLTDKLVCE